MQVTQKGGLLRATTRLAVSAQSPHVRAREQVALSFLRRHGLSPSLLDSIDLAADVREILVLPGDQYLAYRPGPLPGPQSWNPHGVFFAIIGSAPKDLGIRPNNRIVTRYMATRRTAGLRSRIPLSGSRWNQAPKFVGATSGWQVLIPHADNCLKLV